MSQEQFVKFYQDFLPSKPDLEKQLNGIGEDKNKFAATAVQLGTSNGFKFGEDDVRKVMDASQANYVKSHAGLSDDDLEAVVGGAIGSVGTQTVSIGSISSPLTSGGVKDIGNIVGDYAMCCW